MEQNSIRVALPSGLFHFLNPAHLERGFYIQNPWDALSRQLLWTVSTFLASAGYLFECALSAQASFYIKLPSTAEAKRNVPLDDYTTSLVVDESKGKEEIVRQVHDESTNPRRIVTVLPWGYNVYTGVWLREIESTRCYGTRVTSCNGADA